MAGAVNGGHCRQRTGLRDKQRRSSGLAEERGERSSFARRRTDGDLRLVRLHDAVDDGEAEPGATFEAGLEGLEDFFNQLRLDAGPGVLESDAPVVVLGV